jgi:hypothetical protein
MECDMTELNWIQSLTRELADRDDRQLLDMGVVRAADGSLRLAADPSLPATPAAPLRTGLGGAIRAFLGEIRAALTQTSVAGHPGSPA